MQVSFSFKLDPNFESLNFIEIQIIMFKFNHYTVNTLTMGNLIIISRFPIANLFRLFTETVSMSFNKSYETIYSLSFHLH